jgi:uncharacterized membrane-anchored protein
MATLGLTPTMTTSSAAPLGLPEHPLRLALNDELHARPATRLEGPTWISHLVMLHAGAASSAGEEEAHLQKLCRLAAGEPFCPLIQGDHWVMEAGPLRLKWERHNEFSTYTFLRRRQPGDSPDSTALEAFPTEWRQAIPGQLMVATHVEYGDEVVCDQAKALAELEARGQSAVAAWVSDHEALLIADFRLREGATRYLLIDHGMRPLQAGRTVQRLIEIETYRMMALLAFPVAKEVSRFLGRAEDELSTLMDQMTEARTPEDERQLLASLTRLAAEVERSVSATAFRFGAAEAYYNIVRQRIDDLREQRVEGFPSMKGFMERRLGPAIQTCLSAARRQNDLSGRIARKSALLRTRVDIELERQNQELLSQMNRRARLQLRLQETVEGLSVVAITYYASQIVHYLAKGAKPIAPWLSPEVATALAIPVIAGFVALGLRRMRRELAAEESGGSH